MKTATHRGQCIAYDVTGSGPAVVLQHGLLSNRLTWHQAGYVERLADAYTVVCVDSLGHGDSDKPTDASLYQREARAGDVVAVLDAEGIERAHYVGYSMGGWIGTGMLLFQKPRLLSLTIGGWDPVGGMASQPPMDFGQMVEMAREAAPQLAAWITDEVRPGLTAAWEALADVSGVRPAMEGAGIPMLLWAGHDDGCFEAMRTLAASIPGVEFLGAPGDHITARMVHVQESVGGLRRFLDRVK